MDWVFRREKGARTIYPAIKICGAIMLCCAGRDSSMPKILLGHEGKVHDPGIVSRCEISSPLSGQLNLPSWARIATPRK